MTPQEGEQRRQPPPEDAGGLLLRRLAELNKARGSEAAEQYRVQKWTGRPLPKALVLFRRLGQIAEDMVGQDERTQRDFAILQFACGRAILDELIRQDAELSVIVNRQRGRPDTATLLGSDAQDEVARALEDQRRGLEEAFPRVDALPLSPRQQQWIGDVMGRVAIRQPQPMHSVSLDRTSLKWPSLMAQQQAEATLAATGPDPAAHRKVIVKKDRPGR